MKLNFTTVLDKDIVKEKLFYRTETYNQNGKLAHIDIYSSSFTFDYIWKDLIEKYKNKKRFIELIISN
jgi:hypothetical protein